jgi:DNA-binding transcriptional LysR family regulator
VVGDPGYFAKHGKPKRIEDLAAHDCLAFTTLETRLTRPWRFIEGGVEKTFTPRGAMSFSDGAAVCDAAIAGYGLAQLQGYFAEGLIASGALLAVLEKFKPGLEPVWLVYPQTRHLSPKVRAFVDFMAAQFKGGASAARRSAPSRSRAR